MSSKDIIRHPGIICELGQDHVLVKIAASSGCASCQVKGSCSMVEMKDKIIQVTTPVPSRYAPGDAVSVQMDLQTGTRAVVLGYVLPLILLLSVLIPVYLLTGKDGLAGLLGIAILIPYYYLIYRFRNLLQKKTVFTLQPQMPDLEPTSCSSDSG